MPTRKTQTKPAAKKTTVPGLEPIPADQGFEIRAGETGPGGLTLKQAMAIVARYEQAFNDLETNKWIEGGRFIHEMSMNLKAIIRRCREDVAKLSQH